MCFWSNQVFYQLLCFYPEIVCFFLQDDQTVEPLTYGRIASYYYLKHPTIRMFKERMRAELPLNDLLSVLTVSFTSPAGHSENLQSSFKCEIS